MNITPFQAKIIEINSFTSEIKHFRAKVVDKNHFDFIAGQFISIHFEHNQKPLKRSYSIACPPNQDNIIEFSASYVPNGPGSEYLFNLKIDDVIKCTGPFGKLILRSPLPKRLIFIATSTGITPFRSMLPSLEDAIKNNDTKIVIIFGTRTRDDILFYEEFKKLAATYKTNFKYIVCLSRMSSETLDSFFETHGYVQTQISNLNIDINQDLVYLCGNPKMIDESFSILQNLGLDTNKIIREKYIS